MNYRREFGNVEEAASIIDCGGCILTPNWLIIPNNISDSSYPHTWSKPDPIGRLRGNVFEPEPGAEKDVRKKYLDDFIACIDLCREAEKNTRRE